MALSTPDSDQRDFRDTSPGLRLVLLCVFSVALMVLDNQNQHIQDVRRILSAATYPIRWIVDAPFALGHWAGDSLSTGITLRAENRELQVQILTQDARLQRMAALEAENARLRALLESTAKVGDRVLIAEIMSVDMNPFRHQIVVNKGSRHDVYVGQALIDAQGVVGQVIRDQIFSAEALLITDVDHALPVELVRNRLRTIAVGTGDLERLSLPFLPRNADVLEGDLLVTSGLGGTFPAGYPVGVVSEVSGDTGQPFLKITATPAAALNRIREVLFIWPDRTESGTVAKESDTENTVVADDPANEHADDGATETADATNAGPVSDPAAVGSADTADNASENFASRPSENPEE
jgi:rod shape-determining protein MreC